KEAAGKMFDKLDKDRDGPLDSKEVGTRITKTVSSKTFSTEPTSTKMTPFRRRSSNPRPGARFCVKCNKSSPNQADRGVDHHGSRRDRAIGTMFRPRCHGGGKEFQPQSRRTTNGEPSSRGRGARCVGLDQEEQASTGKVQPRTETITLPSE